MTDAATTSPITVVPSNEASCEVLQAVLGTRGESSLCQCQLFKTPARTWDREMVSGPVEERAHKLREQRCGQPEVRTTSGLVAYLDGEPVGWCAVEPRTAYIRLQRKPLVWAGRTEVKTDDSVWAVTCLITRAGFRRRGVSRSLARAAVDFARQRGARALEGYPMITVPGEDITWRAPRRQPQHLRCRRLRGGQSPHSSSGRDAHRLIGAGHSQRLESAYAARNPGPTHRRCAFLRRRLASDPVANGDARIRAGPASFRNLG